MSADLAFSTLLDVLIAVLLIATIAYAVSLNRKLARLRGDRNEMEAAIGRLIEATEQARQGLDELHAHAGQVGERLQQALDRSRGRVDELAFLIEKAEVLSRRLDGNLAAARARDSAPKAAPPGASPGASPSASPGASPGASSAARPPRGPQVGTPPEETSLLKALQGMR